MDEAQKCLQLIQETLKALQAAKPAGPSEEARRYAVTITEQEKVFAYFKTYIFGQFKRP